MKTPHKYAELIKAWADGAEIEYSAEGKRWYTAVRPTWDTDYIYRIKPQPKPDAFYYGRVDGVGWLSSHRHPLDNVKFTFDGETGKLKTVELLK